MLGYVLGGQASTHRMSPLQQQLQDRLPKQTCSCISTACLEMPRSIGHIIRIVTINACVLNVTCLGTNEACRGGRESKARAFDVRASDLCLHPGVLYECPRIRCEAAHSHADVCVHLCNLLDAGWLLSTRGTQSFDEQSRHEIWIFTHGS